MLNQEDIRIIERYISGIADEKETCYIEALFSQGQGNFSLRNFIEKDWETEFEQPLTSNTELNSLLDRVHHIIRNKENDRRKLLVNRLVRVYSRVAAILLLPLIVAGTLLSGYFSKSEIVPAVQYSSSMIHSPYGARVSFSLPDGTVGWLNSGSTLTYTIPFNENRNITLQGEAWFDVVHNEKSPFEISVGNSKVKVLGTSFNVSAYPGESYIEVVLQHGKVEFYPGNSTQKIAMNPYEKLILKEGNIDVSLTDPSKYKAWTDGKLVFRGDNMAEVARRIERWYNVKVYLADEDLKKFSFRATFEDDSLEEVLRLLSLTSPIGYKIATRNMKSDGSFEKEIVTLFKKSKIN